MASIYVVEDDENIREIETFALKNSGYTVTAFECAKDFYSKIASKVPNLVILDIMLPDEDGLEILRKLRNRPETKKMPIILVTAKTTEIDKVKGLDLGADDYLTKPFGVMEMVSRVKALLRRSIDMSEEKFLSYGSIFIDNEKRAVYVNDELIDLTYKEYELLKLLMINVGIVLKREVIMDKIWGGNFETESRTMDVHMRTLRHKLKEAGSEIKTVRNVGYIMGNN
ncbi:response regulator transcription factor [Clostridium sp. HCP1S3_B4]|uniref:response regulator transcription factor n=1 Tax=unclassified Clostridium TaxID=2614128 RepID=UPI0016A772E4|nr:response regulator transcription factor [Clostridiales bacterium]MDY2728513.1 response regulator transcription factor [Clostridium sp.]NLK22876.1 response regulator transcription factor [Clostridiales bacterium]